MLECSGSRSSWALSCTLIGALSLSVAGCQKHGAPEGSDTQATSASTQAGDGDGDGSEGPSSAANDDRIPAFSGAALGLAPGYLDGALLYANWRAGVMQELLQSVPISPREARDLAEVGALFGVDPRVDDVLAHLGIDPNARISMSVRPVIDDSERLAAAASAEQGIDPALLLEAKRLGVHLRVHLPVAKPGNIDGVLARFGNELHRDARWATSCAAVGPNRVCGGDSSGVAVVRDVPGGLQLDALFTFVGDYEQPDNELRRASLLAAIQAPAMRTHTEVAALRGDAALLIDSPTLAQTMQANAVARLISAIARPEDEYLGLDRLRGRMQAIRELHETERMFEGVTLELQIERDRMLALGRWRPTAHGRRYAGEVFALDPVDADVPSIAALCDGALICGRSRGIPQRSRFATLATGAYADPKQLERTIDRNEDEAMALLLLETWPNALGSLARLPGTGFDPAEAMILQNVIDMSTRVLGLGFSVRSLAETRRSLTGDWVGYLRTTAPDLTALRGFLQLAGLNLSPVTIPELAGRVEFGPVPEPDVPSNYYAIYDPKADTGEWGWAVLADADDRVRWLAKLPHDDGGAPLAYLEIGDLWRLIGSFEDGREELGFARSWLSGRWIRGQLSRGDDGLPQLRVAMGKMP